VVIALLASVGAVAPEDVPNPRLEYGWVADEAGVLSAAEHERLDGLVEGLTVDEGVEIAVVTVDSVSPYTPRAFGTELFNLWGIGSAERDDGLLVLLVMDARRIEMETGYGLEADLPDGWLGTMQTREMVPLFKQDRYGAGLVAGLEAIDDRLRNRGSVAPPSAGVKAVTGTRLGYGVAAVGGLGLVGLLVVRARRRRRGEVDPLPDLNPGQRAEHELGSVRWEVARDKAGRVVFEGFVTPGVAERCNNCGYLTRTPESTACAACEGAT